jgi:hypothetical protein
MTYEQYKQLFDEATAQIADRVAKIQPRAGNRASVNGMGISIEPVGEAEEEPDETWRYVLLGHLVGTTTISGDFDIGPENATVVSREGDVLNTYFWEQTQLYDFVPDDAEPFSRTYTLFLTSASVDTNLEQGEFKFPTNVTLELYPVDGNGLPLDPVAEYDFFVGFSGDSRAFVAPSTNTNYFLRVKTIVRSQ